MGIDLQTFSRELPKKLLGRMSGRKALEEIDRIAQAWASANQLGPFYTRHFFSDTEMQMQIYPLGEPLQFDLRGAGLGLSARTSNSGPGYHAAVVDLLDHIGREARMAFEWGTATDSGDETHYAVARDFGALQQAHARFMQTLGTISLREEMEGHVLCLPIGLGMDVTGIAAPQGVLPRDWAARVDAAADSERSAYAARFFSWWAREKTAAFWENTLRGLLWTEAQWRPPRTEGEHATHLQVDYCLAQCGGNAPADLAAAAAELIASINSPTRAAATGIGYRRRPVMHTPFEGWDVKLPGTMAPSMEDFGDDAGAYQVFDEQASLRIASMIVEKPDADEPFEWLDDFARRPDLDNAHERVRQLLPERDDDGLIHQFAMAVYEDGARIRLLMLTLTTTDEAQLPLFADWLRAVRYRPMPIESRVETGTALN
jgi:hypothetical protein